MADPRRPFGQPLEDRQLVGDFVQQAETAADQVGRYLPADAQHRRVGRVGGGERRGGVQQARPRHHGKGAGLAGGAGIAQRHIGGGLLVPRVDDADRLAGIVERDEQRVVLHPGQREQGIDPVPGQHLDQRAAARHPCHRHLLFMQPTIHAVPPRDGPSTRAARRSRRRSSGSRSAIANRSCSSRRRRRSPPAGRPRRWRPATPPP